MRKLAKFILFIAVLTVVLTVARTIAIGIGVGVLMGNLVLAGLFFLSSYIFGYFKGSKKKKDESASKK